VQAGVDDRFGVLYGVDAENRMRCPNATVENTSVQARPKVSIAHRQLKATGGLPSVRAQGNVSVVCFIELSRALEKKPVGHLQLTVLDLTPPPVPADEPVAAEHSPQ